jgi:hypothetical protein
MSLGGINSFAGNGYLTGGSFANAAGSGQGATVTVQCNFVGQWGQPLLPSPSSYVVSVAASQACFHSVSNKTASGFTVVLTPTSSTATLAAGSIDCIVTA